MRIFQDPMEMIKEVERDLFEMGIRYQSTTVQDQQVENNPDFMTIELMGYTYALIGFEGLNKMVKYLDNNLVWATKEGDERLCILDPMRSTDCNPGMAWLYDEKRWENFLRDGKFAYSYTERWHYQLPYILSELIRRPNSRQIIMTMYDVHQDLMNWGGQDRVPCSISYHFIARDGKLNIIYNQRSCDFLKFFSTDVYITCMLLANMVNAHNALVEEDKYLQVGRLIHSVGSLHAFAKDLEGRNIF